MIGLNNFKTKHWIQNWGKNSFRYEKICIKNWIEIFQVCKYELSILQKIMQYTEIITQ